MLGYERTITRTNNWPFPRPLYQNEVKCSAFDMEMIFHSHANKSHFHEKSCALGLILRVRVFGLLQCDYNNQGQFNYNIHLVRCNFFKLLKVGLPLGKMFIKLSISFTNYAIFHEKLRFEVNYAKSQHRRMSEALHKRWGHLMLFPSSFETRELFRWVNHWKQQAASDYESISVSSQNGQHADNIFFPNGAEGTSKDSRRFAHGKYGGGKVILLYSEDTYLLGFGKQWPPNDFQIWPSSPCMAIETLFVGNLRRCTLDEWRRLYFWTTHLFLLFCSVSSICTVTVSNSSLLNRHVLEQTYIGQLKINQRVVWWPIGLSHCFY